jgi:transcriptional regulator with XRE-family HTH domain
VHSGPKSTNAARLDPSPAGTTIRQAIHEGDRQVRRTSFTVGEDFRELRLGAGVSQAAVARAIGVARSVICRLEAGDPSIGPATRARAAAVLGATFKFAIYADDAPLIHDAAHARIVERLLALRHRRWRATVEAPIPGPGPGRRSADVRLDHGRDIVLIEVETRIRRLEEIVREQHDKRTAVREALGAAAQEPLGVPAHANLRIHVVLVVPPTRHHRALVRAHPETIRTAYPAPSTALRAALTAPTGDWPGDGLLWIAAGRTTV